MLAAGTQIDRYVVEGTLGEGGMAVVYRVRHVKLGTHHALKVLALSAGGARRRMLVEGRAQAGLDHPNAVAVSDVIDVEGSPGLLMEFVPGGTLQDWLETKPSRAEKLEVFRGICSAVAAAHDLGWVHRDLKPDNVLMKPTDEGFVPKVADFGIVKLLGEEDGGKGRTRAGALMGTPGYMAPEQVEDASAVDARADVFSLGCILGEMLRERAMFSGETSLDLLSQVARGEHARLPPSDPLAPVVHRCLHRDRERRPEDAGALLEWLDRPPAPPARSAVPWVLAAGLGMAAAAALFAGFITIVLLQVSGPSTDCSLGEAGRLGYLRLPDRGRVDREVAVVLPEDAEVLRDARDEDSVICTLPAGTTVVTQEVVRRGWVAVYGTAVTL